MLWAIAVYNRLVRLRNQVRTAWADIDVQLIRRHDLVPPLVNAVGAYAGHERAVLEAVTELRAQALAQTGPARLAQVEDQLEQAIGRLFALKEAYPDLKANENFAQRSATGAGGRTPALLLQRRRARPRRHPALPRPAPRRPVRLQGRGILRKPAGQRAPVKVELP